MGDGRLSINIDTCHLPLEFSISQSNKSNYASVIALYGHKLESWPLIGSVISNNRNKLNHQASRQCSLPPV